MFTSLRIQNFKAWQDTDKIRLAPLTVFFGPNSSGKTSIGQFLLMLRQTTESPDRNRVLHLGDKNSPVELGLFEDIVYAHEQHRSVSFSFEWVVPQGREIEVADTNDGPGGYSSNKVEFSATVGKDDRESMLLKEMKYFVHAPVGRDRVEVEMRPSIGEGSHEAMEKYELEVWGAELKRKPGRPWGLPAPTHFYGFPPETTTYYQDTDPLDFLELELERQFLKLHYLGPLRDYPARQYSWSGEQPEHVAWDGSRAVEALLAARKAERKIASGKRHYREFGELVARWLKDLELIEEFRINRIAKNRKEYEVLVRTKGSSEIVNITDVGFGVSQVFPVVVECFYASPGSTIILEQPEIHLHPRVQALLADLFIEAIQSRENGENRNTQLIVESHSEHFLRRIQRRIAEGKLSPDNAALYFCKPGRSGAKLEELKVDLFGNIVNWPDNFFGDEIGDLAAMTEAAMQRKEAGQV